MTGPGARNRMEPNPPRSGNCRRQHGRPVPHRGHRIELDASQRLERFFDAVETHRNRAVAPGIFHTAAAVGGQQQIQSQPSRGLVEYAYLVSGGGGNQQ